MQFAICYKTNVTDWQGKYCKRPKMIIKKTEVCGCEKPQAVCVCRYSGQIRTQRCPQWCDNRQKTNQLLLGTLPVWPISRPRCETWVMGTEALTCWSLLLLLLLHTQIALPLALQKVQFSGYAYTHMQINHVDKNKTLFLDKWLWSGVVLMIQLMQQAGSSIMATVKG